MEEPTGCDENPELEHEIWQALDLLHDSRDPAEPEMVALGLLFLKYVSDTPELQVPAFAGWTALRKRSKDPDFGASIEMAIQAIEMENPELAGIFPRVYAQPLLDQQGLARWFDLVTKIGAGPSSEPAGLGLKQVFEAVLTRFLGSEVRSGDTSTPASLVRLMVEMVEPSGGRIYDPCCGPGALLVQAAKFVETRKRGSSRLLGQERNVATWKIARMNLAIHGFEADLGEPADALQNDLFLDLRAEVVFANPPFDTPHWADKGADDDVRWCFGKPPKGNANFAWIQHCVHHLAPGGTAACVMANGSMSATRSGEREIRQELVEAGLVECLVACPGQLFSSTQIPVCLWLLKRRGKTDPMRERILFIDARQLGQMQTRRLRVLVDQEIARIVGTYHAWRNQDGEYSDVPGFCRAAKLEEIAALDFVLTPSRYVKEGQKADEQEPFEQRMARLLVEYDQQLCRATRLDHKIKRTLESILI